MTATEAAPQQSTSDAPTAAPAKPGVVLGPDGKPCRTCMSSSGFKNMLKMSSGGESAKAAAPVTPAKLDECPADVETLGRHTWTFLHTAAAYYPEKPSQAHQSSMLGLLKSLPTLYPCGHCADALKTEMKSHPPEPAIQNRGTLSQWMCDIHNEVNGRLGKEIFDCSKTDERWRTGWKDGSCDL